MVRKPSNSRYSPTGGAPIQPPLGDVSILGCFKKLRATFSNFAKRGAQTCHTEIGAQVVVRKSDFKACTSQLLPFTFYKPLVKPTILRRALVITRGQIESDQLS